MPSRKHRHDPYHLGRPEVWEALLLVVIVVALAYSDGRTTGITGLATGTYSDVWPPNRTVSGPVKETSVASNPPPVTVSATVAGAPSADQRQAPAEFDEAGAEPPVVSTGEATGSAAAANVGLAGAFVVLMGILLLLSKACLRKRSSFS